MVAAAAPRRPAPGDRRLVDDVRSHRPTCVALGAAIERPRNPYVYISGVFAAGWVLAAWLRPEADYIAFPVLVAGSFPISYRLALGPIPLPVAAGAAIGGTINTIVVALLLEIAGILGGPDLLPGGSAVVQATILGALGGLAGMMVAAWRRSG